MKRGLIALFLGLGMMGCAAGEEDQLPPAEQLPEPRNPPSQTLSGNLQNPVGMQLGNIENIKGLDGLTKTTPPIPEPPAIRPQD